MTLNLEQLKQTAQRAPQSKWESYTIPGKTACHLGKILVGIGNHEVEVIAPEGGSLIAIHIAAFDPPTALALIARIEELEATIEQHAAEIRKAKAEAWQEGYSDCMDYHLSNGLKGTETNPYTEEP